MFQHEGAHLHACVVLHAIDLIQELARRLLVPLATAEARVRRLEQAGLVRRVAIGSDTEGVVPARSPDRVKVSEVIEVFQPETMDPGPNRRVEETVNDLIAAFLEAGHDRVGDLTFRDLLDRVVDDIEQ